MQIIVLITQFINSEALQNPASSSFNQINYDFLQFMEDFYALKIFVLVIITQVVLNGVGWMKIQYVAAQL